MLQWHMSIKRQRAIINHIAEDSKYVPDHHPMKVSSRTQDASAFNMFVNHIYKLERIVEHCCIIERAIEIYRRWTPSPNSARTKERKSIVVLVINNILIRRESTPN